MATADDHLHATEVTLRELIEDTLRAEYGAGWAARLGVTSERIDEWQRRMDEEGRRRVGVKLDDRLLSYADFYELLKMLKRNWELFKPCFGDQKRLEVYLSRLGALRDPGAHSRQLVPFEQALIEGMTGEIRQQVSVFRSEGGGGPEPEFFARITEVSDSFGNRTAGLEGDGIVVTVNTGLTLHPGDRVQFSGSAWDPEALPLRWLVRVVHGGHDAIYDAEGEAMSCEWVVDERDITTNQCVSIHLRTLSRPYQRTPHGDEDRVAFLYRVMPNR